jgi:phosphoribosylaminoimidazole carboxylase PurE protein
MADRLETKEGGLVRQQRVVIIMGSEKDLEHCKEIGKVLDSFEVLYDMRICSAHKDPVRLSKIISEYEQRDVETVYIGVAGRQNALALSIPAHTAAPVISLPIYKEDSSFAIPDIISAMRSPSGVSAATFLFPEGAALHALRILALNNKELASKILAHQQKLREETAKTDALLSENCEKSGK